MAVKCILSGRGGGGDEEEEELVEEGVWPYVKDKKSEVKKRSVSQSVRFRINRVIVAFVQETKCFGADKELLSDI